MNYEWIGKITQKIRSKNWKKTVKIKVKLPHVNKKPWARKQIFVQTPFSHSTLKLQRKNFTPQNHSLFCSIFRSGVTKNYSNLTSKIMKILEKQRPNTIQILWNVKNQEKANNSPSYRCAAIKKQISRRDIREGQNIQDRSNTGQKLISIQMLSKILWNKRRWQTITTIRPPKITGRLPKRDLHDAENRFKNKLKQLSTPLKHF